MKVVDQARYSTNRKQGQFARRREIVRQAGRIIAERAYGTVLYHLVTYYFWFWQPYVKNYAPNWNKDGFPLTNTWLDR